MVSFFLIYGSIALKRMQLKLNIDRDDFEANYSDEFKHTEGVI